MIENGGLYQKEDVKILILYTLSKINRAVHTSVMVDMFLNTDIVEYFTLAQAIDELISTEHIAVDVEEGVTVLTRLGYEAADQLYTRLPLYARERALKGALGLLSKIERQSGTVTKTIERDGQYIAQCSLMESDSVLLKMELLVPSPEFSFTIEENFKNQAFDIYKFVIERLSRNNEQE